MILWSIDLYKKCFPVLRILLIWSGPCSRHCNVMRNHSHSDLRIMSGQNINFGTFFSCLSRVLSMTPEDLQQTEQQELSQPFLRWWMAVLLFGAKPVTGSTSRKWDTTCLALLPRMYSLASLSPRWDSCQIQSIASERSWRDVCRHTAWRSFLEQDYRGEQSYGIPLVVWDCFTIFLSSLDRCVQRSSGITSILFWTTMPLLPRKRLSPLYSLLLHQPGQACPA